MTVQGASIGAKHIRGGGMSGLKRVGRRRDDALSRVAWDRLEALLATYYRDRGFEVDEVGTGATGARFDGGVDLRLSRDDERIVLQCKHWNAMKVPHNAVHELLGIMFNEGATGAILVTSGEFSRAAIEAASRHGHVQLIDGDALRRMLGPLPEPALVSPSGVELDGFEFVPFDAVVEERLPPLSHGRIHAQRDHRARRLESPSVTLVKLGIAIVFGLLALTIFGYAMQSVVHGLAHRPHLSASVSTGDSTSPGTASTESTEVDPWTVETVESPPAAAASAPTPAEIREQQHKAAEAIKTIEKSTPEM